MRRPLQWAARARQAALCLLALAALVLSFVGERKDPWIIRFLFATVVMGLASGLIGGLIEILFGPSWWVRGTFIVAGVVCAITRAIDDGKPDTPVAIVGVMALFDVWFGGYATWFLRWRDHRAWWPKVLAAERDLARGEVLVFGDGNDDGKPANASESPRKIELLPESHFVVAIDGVAHEKWEVVAPVSPALRPLSVVESPLSNLKGAPEDHLARTERALTAPEAADLQREARRAFRGDLAKAAFWAWIAGQAAHFFKGPLSRSERVDVVALTVLGIVGVWLLTRAFRRRARASRDLANGHVLVMRPATPGPEGPAYVEVLPQSEILWTVDGQPAPWRKTAP